MRACARCGDFLAPGVAEDASPNESLCAPCRARAVPVSTIPFENASRPLLRRYLATVIGAVLSPTPTFARAPAEIGRAILFGLPGGVAATAAFALTSGPQLMVTNPFQLGSGPLRGAAWLVLLACCGALLVGTILIQHALVRVLGGRGGLFCTAAVAGYVSGACAWLIAIPDGYGMPFAFVAYHVSSARGLWSAHALRGSVVLFVLGFVGPLSRPSRSPSP